MCLAPSPIRARCRWIKAAPLTLLQLAALSGGDQLEGRYNDLPSHTHRHADGKTERKVVNLDIKKIRDGKADDPILQADDIVFLPTNQMKAAINRGAPAACSESSRFSSPAARF